MNTTISIRPNHAWPATKSQNILIQWHTEFLVMPHQEHSYTQLTTSWNQHQFTQEDIYRFRSYSLRLDMKLFWKILTAIFFCLFFYDLMARREWTREEKKWYIKIDWLCKCFLWLWWIGWVKTLCKPMQADMLCHASKHTLIQLETKAELSKYA